MWNYSLFIGVHVSNPLSYYPLDEQSRLWGVKRNIVPILSDHHNKLTTSS